MQDTIAPAEAQHSRVLGKSCPWLQWPPVRIRTAQVLPGSFEAPCSSPDSYIWELPGLSSVVSSQQAHPRTTWDVHLHCLQDQHDQQSNHKASHPPRVGHICRQGAAQAVLMLCRLQLNMWLEALGEGPSTTVPCLKAHHGHMLFTSHPVAPAPDRAWLWSPGSGGDHLLCTRGRRCSPGPTRHLLA